MYRHTITFTTEAKPTPGDLNQMLALLNNRSNHCRKTCEVKTEEV